MEYYIPKNVKARFEVVPGFGIKELGIVLSCAVIGLIVAAGIFSVSKSALSFLLVLVFGGIGFVLSKPDPRTGRSPLSLYKDVRAYKSKPKRYYYRFGDGRE
ncbi:PrgI family protein [Paenibacillus campinasensis]|uniref:PrgI family protein n=1 Tax=Paenibacillus campinasensis TaxID=66347 RepID=A0A268EE09_9BACL|nr:PrgI family protein [Paenibacillus campinasensis]PAD71349.1 PrgI family protein [Paenibacillus campinasensis]